MPLDTHYIQGQSHLACQDYAAQRGNVAALADGCSSAEHSDVGARLLVHAALRAWPSLGKNCVPGEVCTRVAFQAAGALVRAGLHDTGMKPIYPALYATLGVLSVDGSIVTATLAGDGVIFGKRRDGAIEIEVCDFANLPPYLAYGLEVGVFDRYMAESGRTGAECAPRQATYDLAEYDLVGIASDGVCATTLDVDEVLAQLCAVKVRAGRFAARRLRRLAEHDWPRANVRFEDDISVVMVTP